MSVFSFPRWNVKGLLIVNVGTGNNDDYSRDQFPPESPYAGQPVRLADSIQVQALTYGKTDPEWIKWVQEPGEFVSAAPGSPAASVKDRQAMTRAEGLASVMATNSPVTLIPGEWNYYGDMGLTMTGVTVVGATNAGAQVPSDPLLGAELSFKNRPGAEGRSTAMLIDVNAEDVPCSQVFSDNLMLEKDGQALMNGKPSKGATRWINFQRNTALNGPNGAAAMFQCVVPLAALAGQPIAGLLPATSPSGRPLAGVVFRYNIFRSLQPINTFKYEGKAWFDKMVELYQQQDPETRLNPDISEIAGTLAPWYEGEMESVPVGRQLVPTDRRICVPAGLNNAGPCSQCPAGQSCFALAPAIVGVDEAGGWVSLDLSGSLPDALQGTDYDPRRTGNNPKYDFGEIRLVVRQGSESHDFGSIPYQDTEAGDQRGWIFDYPLPSGALDLIRNGDFFLTSPTYGDLLAESRYFVASDQSCIYGQQDGPPAQFVNEGTAGPATVRVFEKGRELDRASCPPMQVWEYDTTPNQSPGPRTLNATGFRAGDPLSVITAAPGNRLFTFTMPDDPEPPENYSDLNLMVAPQINLRLLPNEDFSSYYVNPSSPEPVGNERLIFQVIFENVFRNYYLLYPAMNLQVPLNDPEYWADPVMARLLMQRVQRAWWNRAEYMPRTRDLSDSRRTLIEAWCRKIIQNGGE